MISLPTSARLTAALRSPRAWQVLLAALSIALYVRTVGFGWVFDDQMDVVRNVYAHGLGSTRQVFTTTVWAGSGMETYLYRPLVVLSYALNYIVSGLDPWSYHLVNVLLAALVSVLVFRVGRAWRLGVVSAGVGALLFAVHPTHVEVVANVAGRKDLLAGVFVLGMALIHRSAVDRTRANPDGRWWVGAAAVFYLGAMLSKEVGVVGLLLVAAQDLFLEEDRGVFFKRPRVRWIYGLYTLGLLAYLSARGAVTGGMGVPQTYTFDNPIVGLGPAAGLATACVLVLQGLLLLLVPWRLSPDYSFDAIPVVTSPWDVRLLTLVAGVASLVWLFRSGRMRGTVLPLLTAWYIAALLPSSNLLVRVGTIFGERLLFLPGVALCLGLGAGLSWLFSRRRALAVVCTVLLAAGFALQSWRYTNAWTDDVALFRWAVQSVPRSTKAHHKLGEELLRAGDLGGSLEALERALDIAPDNEFAAMTLSTARNDVATRFATAGPEGPAVPHDARILYALGQRARESGAWEEAASWWRQAVAVDPEHARSLGDLGTLELTRGDTAAAVRHLEQAVLADTALAAAWFNLAGIRLARRDLSGARQALQRFVQAAGPRHLEQVAWARSVLADLDRR